tara:strand:- start:4670 stop:5299 length:630 start_codon:yes stop_codon:yes gene_type:complete
MTVNISKPALNLREELTTLRNQNGAYGESKFYLDYLVTNGTFDTDANWTKGVGWAISAGVASCDGTQTGNSDLVQTNDLTDGVTYAVTYTVSGYVAGSVYGWINGNLLTPRSANGTFTDYIELTGANTTIGLRALSTFVGSIDNISVYETDGTNVIHSTPHGYSIKDVYIDGVLAREGSAYDYTVHDGYIKPTIAPTATTETCLIGVRT